MEEYAAPLRPELQVSYCRLISVSVDDPERTRSFRDQIGAKWQFLIDADRAWDISR